MVHESPVKAGAFPRGASGGPGAGGNLWKLELQAFANESGLAVSDCDFPRGTSKWNKVEHRLSSFISSNWRGELLCDYVAIVNVNPIARTTAAKGPKVTCRLDRRKYPDGGKVTAEAMRRMNLERSKFHEDRNYSIHPNA